MAVNCLQEFLQRGAERVLTGGTTPGVPGGVERDAVRVHGGERARRVQRRRANCRLRAACLGVGCGRRVWRGVARVFGGPRERSVLDGDGVLTGSAPALQLCGAERRLLGVGQRVRPVRDARRLWARGERERPEAGISPPGQPTEPLVVAECAQAVGHLFGRHLARGEGLGQRPVATHLPRDDRAGVVDDLSVDGAVDGLELPGEL